MEEYARELKKFELERALSYVSEILRLRKEKEELRDKKYEIYREKEQWQREQEEEERSIFSSTEKREIERILKELEQQIEEMLDKKETIQEKITELQYLVSKLSEYIFGEEKDVELQLQNNEIKIDFAEEYFYFIQEEDVEWEKIFEEPAYFVVTACINLGEIKREFLTDMVENFYHK